MEGGQPLLDYYTLLTIILWLTVTILIWGIIIILHVTCTASYTDHEDTSVVNKIVANDDTITGTDNDDIDEQELWSWHSAIKFTQPLTNSFPKTDYRLSLRNACRLSTILELPVTEKLEEVRIEEDYCSEVCTANNNMMNSTTVDGSDNYNCDCEEELQSWYSAVATTNPSPNPWPKANYRLNYRYACMLPTMLELPISELEEVRIEEYYYSEVCTANNNVMNSTTVDGSDNDDECIGEEELRCWYSAIATTKPSWPQTNYRLNYRNACMLPTMLELPVSEKLEEVGIEEYYYSEVCTVYSDAMNSATVNGSDNDDGGDVVHEDYENDDSQWITDGLESHSCDYEDTMVDSMKEVVTDSECEICVGQSFGPRDDGYNSMVDFVKEERASKSEGQLQPFKGDLKESVIKHVVELDERIKKIENIVDELEENHQAKMMEQQKNFDQELKDQAKVSERQMQLFRERVKETVSKHLVELEEGFKIVWKMVDVLIEEHQVEMVEQRKMLKEEFGRKLVEKENTMKMQQQVKLEEERKKLKGEMCAKLADLRRMEAKKKQKQEIQRLNKHFPFTLTEAQQTQVDSLDKKFNKKITKAKETYKKKLKVLKEKNEPDMELQSQYLIEDKEWKFCKYRRRFNKKLRKLVKEWRTQHNVDVQSPTEQ